MKLKYEVPKIEIVIFKTNEAVLTESVKEDWSPDII